MKIATQRVIGLASMADIRAWGEDRIVKYFFPDHNEDARAEFAMAERIRNMPFRKLAEYEMIEEDGRLGIVCDKPTGRSLLSIMCGGEFYSPAVAMVLLHRDILSQPGTGFPSYKKALHRGIATAAWLSPEERAAAFAALEALPEGNALCHGEFYPGNIVVDDGGNPIVNGYADYCCGPELYDVAKTVFLTYYAVYPPMLQEKEKLAPARKAAAELYLEGMGASVEEIQPYLEVIAAARPDAPRKAE
ncbi:MAG: hypothetical protein E7458_01925 [Ruminococcaceae bacterium]|nr:hypothetical protein [Oscillospiraceae bacterium]